MSIPAGWYDDGHGSQRWWDGQQWTEHTAASQTPPPAQDVSDRTVVRRPIQTVAPESASAAAPPITSIPPASQTSASAAIGPPAQPATATPAAQPASGPAFASGPQHVPPSRRRRRASAYIAAVFYTVIAVVGAYLAIHTGQPKLWFGALLSGAYATYLWLGGRWVVFFF